MRFLLFFFCSLPAFAFQPDRSYGFLTAGGSSYGNYQPAYGFEFVRVPEKVNPWFGLRGDFTIGKKSTSVITAPVGLILSGYVPLNLRVFMAPGIRFNPHETRFALLAGIGRYFELGNWLLTPEIAVDLADHDATTFFGLQIGRSF